MRTITLTILAMLALAVPASANQWYVQDGPNGHRHRIPTGETVVVPTEGTFKLKIKLAMISGTKDVACAVVGAEELSDPSTTEAFLQTTAISFTECEGGAIVEPALLPPWRGELGGTCQPCSITRPQALHLEIDGKNRGVFTGTVTSRIGDFDEPFKDDIDYVYKNEGTSGGVLTNSAGSTIALAGQEQFGTTALEDRATGEPNGGPAEEEHEGGGE